MARKIGCFHRKPSEAQSVSTPPGLVASTVRPARSEVRIGTAGTPPIPIGPPRPKAEEPERVIARAIVPEPPVGPPAPALIAGPPCPGPRVGPIAVPRVVRRWIMDGLGEDRRWGGAGLDGPAWHGTQHQCRSQAKNKASTVRTHFGSSRRTHPAYVLLMFLSRSFGKVRGQTDWREPTGHSSARSRPRARSTPALSART